jgi:hypothetical protein
MATGYPYLKNVAPTLVAELWHLLFKEGWATLASQIAGLLIPDRCRRGDNFRATFYATQCPRGPFGPGHHVIQLLSRFGMLNVDVPADSGANTTMEDAAGTESIRGLKYTLSGDVRVPA